jgi:hypothetical protein
MLADYFVVCTACGQFVVSPEMARAVEGWLDQEPPAPWIAFVDLTGARIRVRTREVQSLVQCYTENRQVERAMRQALEGDGR